MSDGEHCSGIDPNDFFDQLRPARRGRPSLSYSRKTTVDGEKAVTREVVRDLYTKTLDLGEFASSPAPQCLYLISRLKPSMPSWALSHATIQRHSSSAVLSKGRGFLSFEDTFFITSNSKRSATSSYGRRLSGIPKPHLQSIPVLYASAAQSI